MLGSQRVCVMCYLPDLDTKRGALFELDVIYALGGGAAAVVWELSLCFAFLAGGCDWGCGGGDGGAMFFAFVRTIRGGNFDKRCSNFKKPTTMITLAEYIHKNNGCNR